MLSFLWMSHRFESVICDEVVKNLILYLKKYFIQYNLAGITRFFSLNISRLGSGTSAYPWKNAEYSAYHQDDDSQQASMPYRQETDSTAFSTATMLRPLPTCIARAKNKNEKKSKNCPCRRHHKRTLLYNSRDQESHDRHRYPTT